jgi:hypothetical protein
VLVLVVVLVVVLVLDQVFLGCSGESILYRLATADCIAEMHSVAFGAQGKFATKPICVLNDTKIRSSTRTRTTTGTIINFCGGHRGRGGQV